MNLFQKSFGKGRNMSSVINQDISIGSNLKSLRLQNKLSQREIVKCVCKPLLLIMQNVQKQNEPPHLENQYNS